MLKQPPPPPPHTHTIDFSFLFTQAKSKCYLIFLLPRALKIVWLFLGSAIFGCLSFFWFLNFLQKKKTIFFWHFHRRYVGMSVFLAHGYFCASNSSPPQLGGIFTSQFVACHGYLPLTLQPYLCYIFRSFVCLASYGTHLFTTFNRLCCAILHKFRAWSFNSWGKD